MALANLSLGALIKKKYIIMLWSLIVCQNGRLEKRGSEVTLNVVNVVVGVGYFANTHEIVFDIYFLVGKANLFSILGHLFIANTL